MARMSLKVGIAVAIVAALFVAGWVAATSGGGDGGGSSRAAVTRDEGDKDEGGGEAVQGTAGMVWTGPLVDDHELTGAQMDAVFERLQECMPVYRTPYLELCLQGREDSWYRRSGSAEEVE